MGRTPPDESQAPGAGPDDGSGINASIYRIAYQEGLRVVEDQRAELESMRQRSLQFLAFVGAASGFLIAAGLKNPQRDGLYFSLAITSTVVSIVAVILAILILLGIRFGSGASRSWDFFVDPRILVVDVIEAESGTNDEAKLLRKMALEYARKADANDGPLEVIRRRYLFFLAAASLQLIGWTTVVWCYA